MTLFPLKDIVEAIRSSDDVILGGRRDAFIGYVFYNYKDLRSTSRHFYADLYWRWTHYHTKQRQPIPMIGDILLNHLTLLESHIKEYIPRIPIAKNIMEHELQCNDKLTFLLTCLETSDMAKRLMPRTSTRDLTCTNIVLECLSHPQKQLFLYTEHIERLQHVTNPAHPDYALLEVCAQTVERIRDESTQAMKETIDRVAVLWLHDSLVCKEPGEFYDLQLTSPERRILWESKLFSSTSASSATTNNRKFIHIYILDHVVLITKCGIGDSATLHQICGQPIPLPMLQVIDSPSTRRHALFRIHNHHDTSTMTFVHTVRGEQWSFTCEKHIKDRCLQAIHDAQKIWKKKQHPIHFMPIDVSSFRISQSGDGYDQVHCTVPIGK